MFRLGVTRVPAFSMHERKNVIKKSILKATGGDVAVFAFATILKPRVRILPLVALSFVCLPFHLMFLLLLDCSRVLKNALCCCLMYSRFLSVVLESYSLLET